MSIYSNLNGLLNNLFEMNKNKNSKNKDFLEHFDQGDEIMIKIPEFRKIPTSGHRSLYLAAGNRQKLFCSTIIAIKY